MPFPVNVTNFMLEKLKEQLPFAQLKKKLLATKLTEQILFQQTPPMTLASLSIIKKLATTSDLIRHKY